MILLIGFPKSGTSSFQYLFKELGYNSYHWKKDGEYIGMLIYRNKLNKRPLLNDFMESDVITQMDVCVNMLNSYWPQVTDYKQLREENPDSIFILNKRDPKRLLKSFKNWRKYDERLFTYSPSLIKEKTDEGFIRFIENFYVKVEDYFSQYPNCKFLTFDIEKDGIEKLKQFIDIKDMKEFPKKNVNQKNS